MAAISATAARVRVIRFMAYLLLWFAISSMCQGRDRRQRRSPSGDPEARALPERSQNRSPKAASTVSGSWVALPEHSAAVPPQTTHGAEAGPGSARPNRAFVADHVQVEELAEPGTLLDLQRRPLELVRPRVRCPQPPRPERSVPDAQRAEGQFPVAACRLEDGGASCDRIVGQAQVRASPEGILADSRTTATAPAASAASVSASRRSRSTSVRGLSQLAFMPAGPSGGVSCR